MFLQSVTLKRIRNNRVNISGMCFLVANFLSLALALVNFKLLTSILNQRILAEYALLTTFQNFGTLILTGPLRVALVRYYSSALVEKLKNEFEQFAVMTMTISAIILIASGIIFSICLGMSAILQIVSVFLIIIYGILQDYVSFQAGCAIQLNKAKIAAIRIIISKLSFTVGIIIAYLIERSPSAILIFSLSISALAIATYFTLEEPPKFSFKTLPVYKDFSKRIYSFGWIFILTGLISWAQLNMPRFFISWNYSEEWVSKFYIITQISFLSLSGFMATVSQYLSPRLFKTFDEKPHLAPFPLKKEIIFSAAMMLGLAFLGLCASFVAGDWVVSLLSKKGIADIGLNLGIAFLAYGIYSAAQIFRIYGDQVKAPKKYLWVNIIYPSCAVLFTYLASKYSFSAIFLALLLSEVIHLSGVLIINKKLYKSKLKMSYELSTC